MAGKPRQDRRKDKTKPIPINDPLAKGPRGPSIIIDVDEIEKLATFGCNSEEIATFFNCSKDVLERNECYAAALKKGRSKGHMSLKRTLFTKAQAGDLGALVWFGKNFMGMSDKVEQKVNDENGFKISILDYTVKKEKE